MYLINIGHDRCILRWFEKHSGQIYAVPDHFKTKKMCEKGVHREAYTLQYVPDHLKTQEMCEKPWWMYAVPDCFKTKKMCEKAVEDEPETLEFVPDHFKSLGMCEKVVEERPYLLQCVPDHLKSQEMYEKLFEEDPYSLIHFPDWFVTPQQIGLWRDSKYRVDDKIIKWYKGYQKRKAQKAKIKEELLPIACHR